MKAMKAEQKLKENQSKSTRKQRWHWRPPKTHWQAPQKVRTESQTQEWNSHNADARVSDPYESLTGFVAKHLCDQDMQDVLNGHPYLPFLWLKPVAIFPIFFCLVYWLHVRPVRLVRHGKIQIFKLRILFTIGSALPDLQTSLRSQRHGCPHRL